MAQFTRYVAKYSNYDGRENVGYEGGVSYTLEEARFFKTEASCRSSNPVKYWGAVPVAILLTVEETA